jgi:hypothetical protein
MRIDRQTGMTKLIGVLVTYANAPKSANITKIIFTVFITKEMCCGTPEAACRTPGLSGTGYN